MDGQNTVHTKLGGYTVHPTFVRDNYVQLFAERVQGGQMSHPRILNEFRERLLELNLNDEEEEA